MVVAQNIPRKTSRSAIVEHTVVDVTTLQIVEVTVVVHTILLGRHPRAHQERISHRKYEQIVEVLVPPVDEQIIKVPKISSQGRIMQQTECCSGPWSRFSIFQCRRYRNKLSCRVAPSTGDGESARIGEKIVNVANFFEQVQRTLEYTHG